MKTIVPYTKDISLNAKVAEITSISLEHETEIRQGTLSGEFIISGDYKAHEISINKEPFEFKLPFEVDLSEQVDRESINFEILDFTYDLLNSDTLKVDIEFSVEAHEREIIPEESIFEEVEDDIRLEESIDEFMEAKNCEEVIEEVETDSEERMDEMSQKTILSAAGEDETFKTYHIHMVKENETIESICAIYNVDTDYLKDYNNLDDIVPGDKLLIPDEVNE